MREGFGGILWEALRESVSITLLVLVLMAVVESINISSSGRLFKKLHGKPVAEVALMTNRSANALYGIRHRCLKKLRGIIDAMQSELETPPETASSSEPRTDRRS